MHTKKSFRAVLMGVTCAASALLGVWAFASPSNPFPKGTENCNQFTPPPGGQLNNQNLCVLCCTGTEEAYRFNISPCIALCKKLSNLLPGEKPLLLDANYQPLYPITRGPNDIMVQTPPSQAKPTTPPIKPVKPSTPPKKPATKKKKDATKGKTPPAN